MMSVGTRHAVSAQFNKLTWKFGTKLQFAIAAFAAFAAKFAAEERSVGLELTRNSGEREM